MGAGFAGPHQTLDQQVRITPLRCLSLRANNNIKYIDNIDLKLISVVGENIPAAVRGETTILKHLRKDNMMEDIYEQGLGAKRYNSYLAKMVWQVAHRYPHMKILELDRH